MLFTTPTQYAALAIALVAGWLFGLASHPGGRRWKQRYAEERDAHALTRKESDARVAAERDGYASTRKDHDTALAAERARADELERENDRLAKAAPVTAATIAPRDRVATDRIVADRPVVEPRPYRDRGGWFGRGNRIGTNG
jgi:hypothetical protein